MATKKRPVTMMAATGRRKTSKKVEVKPKKAVAKPINKAAPRQQAPVLQKRSSTRIESSPPEATTETLLPTQVAPRKPTISEPETVEEINPPRQTVDDKSCDPRIVGMACYGCKHNLEVSDHGLAGVGVTCGPDGFETIVAPRAEGKCPRVSKFQVTQEAA